ncbi:glycoside hydrolase family 3 protein [Flagellimonas meishanensis]|uniref:glycoside hydrolase family 3 protein n=1 Tax=Flagellimonas meishanensis TaxID=2873264 RepID=UPI001CA77721|nr:glycoside hydrolase family 3 protein [[Muricauda] meishanensis]
MNEKLQRYGDIKETLSLHQKVGQLFMPAVFINDSDEEIQKMEHLIQKFHIGSLCFFHSRASAATNFEGKKKIEYNAKSLDRLKQLIARYQKASKIPLLIAIDAEWGLAMRVEETPQYPYAITLGALEHKNELIHDVARNIGMDCKDAGIHWNLAPVVDINSNPDNPVIGYRSLGDDKAKVISKAEAFIAGMRTTGILNSLKHFPGHGDTAIDSHLGLPVINKSLETLKENELAPFQQLIDRGVDSIMVGHMSLPQLDGKNPTTVSTTIIQGLLREEMGFKGLIISDALNMRAVSKLYPERGQLEAAAFAAGMDVFCFSEFPADGIQKIVASASKERIEESFKRVWGLKENVFLKAPSASTLKRKDHSRLNKKIAKGAITELFGSPKAVKEISSKHFMNLSLENGKNNFFSTKIHKAFGQKKWDMNGNLDAIKAAWNGYDLAVLALFPFAVKPKDRFGFKIEELTLIRRLVQEKNTLIYLFGNPYALDILGLPPTSNVVLAYQDFPEFQEVAFDHFQGIQKAKGKLPVTLKTRES